MSEEGTFAGNHSTLPEAPHQQTLAVAELRWPGGKEQAELGQPQDSHPLTAWPSRSAWGGRRAVVGHSGPQALVAFRLFPSCLREGPRKYHACWFALRPPTWS